MKKHITTIGITTLVTLATSNGYAWDLKLGTNIPPVTFHGFLSQGFLASTDYNYLGDTTHGSFKFFEAGLNASINPFPRTRISVQGFMYDVGEDVGKYTPILDYAQIDYTFNDYLGVRAGRVRRPAGLYNHIQDVDLARTSVLLPQGIYDARWRDFYATLDGGTLYGSAHLSKAGSLSYEAYGGMVSPSDDGGMANELHYKFPPFMTLKPFESFPTAGGQLWWYTPAAGLRFGIAGNYNFGNTIATDIHLPPPMGGSSSTLVDVGIYQASAEYAWKSWTFQAEYLKRYIMPEGSPTDVADSWYASAAYRFNKWFEAGTYYSEFYGDVQHRDDSLLYQKDLALSLRFDPTDWWIIKVEGHYIHGTGSVVDTDQPTTMDDRGWFMLALKTTFSF